MLFSCDLCDYQCKIKKYLSRHKKQAHSEPTENPCPLCGKCFHFATKLKNHMRVHTGEKPYKCKVCDKAFSAKYCLTVHMLIHTGEKPFKCPYCDYACRDSSTIRKHKERHLGLHRSYECTICNKVLKERHSLKRHIDEMHFGLETRRFPCDQCDKAFKQQGSLNIHIKAVHEKSYKTKCEICDKFVSTGNMSSHLQRHTHIKPFKCTFKQCTRRFVARGDLKKHSLIHYPSKQYPCDVCGRRFTRKQRLNKHMASIHLNNPSVQCDYCMRTYATKAILSGHIQRVHGLRARSYECDECGERVHTRRAIAAHLQYGHGDVTEDAKCKICLKKFTDHSDLKTHYLKKHGVAYVFAGQSKEETITIKQEPCEAIESFVDFNYEVNIEKQEIDELFNLSNCIQETPERNPAETPTPEVNENPLNSESEDEYSTYSRKVMSEDIHRVILNGEDGETDRFDKFFVENVVEKPGQGISALPRPIGDETQKQKLQERIDELKERVRRKNWKRSLVETRKRYNRRIVEAGQREKCKRAPKPIIIKHFKTPSINKSDEASKITGNTSIEEVYNTNTDITSIDNSNSYSDSDNELDKLAKNDHDTAKNEKNKHVNTTENINLTKIKRRLRISSKKSDEKTNTGSGEDIEASNKNGEESDKNGEESDKNCDEDEDSDYGNEVDGNIKSNARLKFNIHQCYICFQLFKTKFELKKHCQNHFDLCNEKMLKKCPYCGFVTNKGIIQHIKHKHKINISINFQQIKEKNNRSGSKYVYEIDENRDLEIIPSIGILNKMASVKIDKNNRRNKEMQLGKTKLVKKGNEWVVEKSDVNINNENLLPKFTKEDYKKVKYIGESYADKLKGLYVLAKLRNIKMLFPCEGCEKICLNLAALKLHSRKHESNPKPFRPKVWKNTNYKNRKSGKVIKVVKNNNDTTVRIDKKRKSRLLQQIKDDSKSNNDTVSHKNDNGHLQNRYANPQPVKNNHNCDYKLIEFYKNNIKGKDIEFWQFLKIFNKMTRDNVKDFKDLEETTDFGWHKEYRVEPQTKVNDPQDTNTDNNKNQKQKKVTKKTKTKSKINRFKRVIMITKEEYLRREAMKQEMRKRIQESGNT